MDNYYIYDHPLPENAPEINQVYFEWIESTYEIKKMNYLPQRNSLLLFAEIEYRADIPFVPHDHGDIGFIDIIKRDIEIYSKNLSI